MLSDLSGHGHWSSTPWPYSFNSTSTLSAIWNEKSVQNFIGQVKASDVIIVSDDIEFYDWSFHISNAHFWSCDDFEQCQMLKLVIEKKIKKLPIYDLVGNLFHVDHGIDKHQFVGFVSSHTKSNLLTSFHLHSFVTFYMDSESNTVVTCTLTPRHHILSNMQDHLMQLIQLMQFWRIQSFSVRLTINLLVQRSLLIKILLMDMKD